MPSLWLACLAAVVLHALVAAETPPVQPVPDQPVRISLDAVLEPIRKEAGLPALAAAVVDRSGVVAAGVVGFRRAGQPEKVTVDDQFHLGSCTKAITGTLAGLLVQEKRIQWETTIAEALPELAAQGLAEYRTVTLRQLLQHRAGLPHTLPAGRTLQELHQLQGTERQQRVTYASWLLAAKPVYQPGAKQEYSNAGYCLAAAMLEATTDTPWDQLVEAKIFKPLAMKTTGYGAMGKAGVFDQPRQHRKDGVNWLPVEPGPGSDNPPAMTPAGRVHCSVLDWAKFVQLQLLADSTSPSLLKKETLVALQTPPTGADYAPGGWMVTQRDWAGGTALNHTGSNLMNYANVWVAPGKGFAVLVLTNAPEFGPTDKVMAELIKKYQAGDFTKKE